MILETISSNADVHKLARPEIDVLAGEIRDTLVQNKESELFGLFMANLRDQMEKSGKIKINEQEMKNLTKQQTESDEGE